MRADRLLSLLLLLQARGQLTAQQLAEVLEVSVRTIYRDVDALSAAGVPVYADRGPGGGFALLDSYRTELTGLTEDEVRALFMISIPEALGQLGLGQELKAALLKLSAALPAERRRDEAWVRQRIYLDWSALDQAAEPVPHLQTIQRAAWEDRKLSLTYRLEYGLYQQHFQRVVEPYGLVAKAGVWHLVCSTEGRMRVYEVSRLLDVRVHEASFKRPDDFDLSVFWHEWCANRERTRPRFIATVRVSPALLSELPQHFGDGIRKQIGEAAPPDAGGWVTLRLPFESLHAARARLLGLGGAVEVLEPRPLRESILDFAQQVVALYAGGPSSGDWQKSGGRHVSATGTEEHS